MSPEKVRSGWEGPVKSGKATKLEVNGFLVSKEEIVLNSLISAAANRWYRNIVQIVAGGERGVTLEDINSGVINRSAKHYRRKAIEVEIPPEKIAGAAEFLVDTGVLVSKEGRYQLSPTARRHWDRFESTCSFIDPEA